MVSVPRFGERGEESGNGAVGAPGPGAAGDANGDTAGKRVSAAQGQSAAAIGAVVNRWICDQWTSAHIHIEIPPARPCAAHNGISVLAGVDAHRLGNASQIGSAFDDVCRFARFRQRWQQDRNQQRDDADDDQKLHQREAANGLHP